MNDQTDPFEAAEREALAQLEIIRALGKLPQERRKPVFDAILHLLAAEELVPGIMARAVFQRREAEAEEAS